MTTTPFSISRFAPADKPIARYRADRAWVDLMPTQAIQPGWKLWLHRFGVVSFMAIALFLACH